MKHYGIDEWVDFVRGVLDRAEADAMRNHLKASCPECVPLADFCRNLQETCRRLGAVAAPDDVVRQARSMFPAAAGPQRRRLARVPVELVFDSFLAPAPAGLRATWQTGWQGLYRAGKCSLDVRIEPELHSSRAAVIGQISNYTEPDRTMAGLPVWLKAGRLVVAETRSNEFGEFRMEYEQQARLQLGVALEDGAKYIQVPLKRLLTETPLVSERVKRRTGSGKEAAGGETRVIRTTRRKK